MTYITAGRENSGSIDLTFANDLHILLEALDLNDVRPANPDGVPQSEFDASSLARRH
jgi:hypothetical protein